MTRADHPAAPDQEVVPSVRAQLLATEHWSLLASRSTTQNELLVRIAIFLTLVSASVVSLALIGQATDFDGRFDAFATVLFSILLLVGSLTLLRVINGSAEDAAYVIGMNRLRAAYAELDPGIDRYFITSKHDDDRGVGQTYTLFAPTSDERQFFASSTMFILVVNAVVAGTLPGVGGEGSRWLGRGHRDRGSGRRHQLLRRVDVVRPSPYQGRVGSIRRAVSAP